ncbi:metal-dependent hydrolase [Vibrio gangliei]|uniref:metal-dependent hydrolase n=1 Tax=Vibrio gangliei TaxID=2077090 RepID=UPI000D01C8C4|nr:metal-dependent hydrolase [Vibrio gangliei]
MDPISQGVLGATAALLVSNKANRRHAAKVGCVAGLAPDLDVLIKSSTDPLLALEFHRQFTHALIFIPFGGLIVAFLLWAIMYRNIPFKQTLLFAVVGYATHGLLDAFTTYGTQLLWPFSNQRIAWDMVGIIDPLVTLPLLVAIIMTCITLSKKWIITGSIFFAAYMSFGALQHHRALEATKQLAQFRGQEITRIKAMPTIGNLIVWRTLYQSGDHYYVDAIRVSLLGKTKIYPGDSIEVLHVSNTYPTLAQNSIQFSDIQRFSWFSDQWVVSSPYTSNSIADLRYSLQVNGIKPLWEIAVDPTHPDKHIQYQMNASGEKRDILPWTILLGE